MTRTRTSFIAASLALSIALTGCSLLTRPSASSAPTVKPTPTHTQEAAEQGARDNPWQPGDEISLTSADVVQWYLSVGEVNWDATKAVLNENMFNDKPPGDSTYVLVPVTVERVADDAARPASDFDVAYVSPSGITYEEEFAVIPKPFNDIADLYAGGKQTGNVAFIVPKDERGGTVRITWGFTLETYFAAPEA